MCGFDAQHTTGWVQKG